MTSMRRFRPSKSPTDFTAGSAIGTAPRFWVANDDGTSYVEALMAKKQKQGLALNWYNEETGESFDWYKTKVTDSIHVVGKWGEVRRFRHLLRK